MAPAELNKGGNVASEKSLSDLHSDPRWLLIERILATAPFQKSSKLPSLLAYLAEHSIRGKAENLNERQIGIAVFGKPVDYSTVEDSAVRVHVRQLRLRLHEYFAVEGRHEAKRLEIPRGSYVLEFEDVEPEDNQEYIPHPSHPQPKFNEAPSRWLRWVLVAALSAAIVCAIGWFRAVSVAHSQTPPWPLDKLIQPDRPTRVVISDSSLMLRRLENKQITLDDFLQPDYRQRMIPAKIPPNFTSLLNYISVAQLTSFADLTSLSSLMKLAGPLNTQLAVTPAHDLDRRDLEHGNYIFLGGPTSNPWVALFTEKLNFQPVEETAGGGMHFHNRNPLPGELTDYQGLMSTGSTGEDYATLTVLPGQMGHGNVMILEGLRQAGTEALALILADSQHRAELQQAVERVAKTPSPYFEVLIRSKAVTGAPVSFSIVAVRIIHP
ncbi:MAG: hypothetical protein ABSF53_17630 [Terracidiphilus sp.]